LSPLSYAYLGLSLLMATALVIEALSRVGWPAPRRRSAPVRRAVSRPPPPPPPPPAAAPSAHYPTHREALQDVYRRVLRRWPELLESELGATELPAMRHEDVMKDVRFLAERMLEGRRVDESPVDPRGPRVFASPLWERGPRGQTVRRIIVSTPGALQYLYGPHMLEDLRDDVLLQALVTDLFLVLRDRPVELSASCLTTRKFYMKAAQPGSTPRNFERVGGWPPFIPVGVPFQAHYTALSLLMAEVCRRRAAGSSLEEIACAFRLLQNPELAQRAEQRFEALERVEEGWMMDVSYFPLPLDFYDKTAERFGRELADYLATLPPPPTATA